MHKTAGCGLKLTQLECELKYIVVSHLIKFEVKILILLKVSYLEIILKCLQIYKQGTKARELNHNKLRNVTSKLNNNA